MILQLVHKIFKVINNPKEKLFISGHINLGYWDVFIKFSMERKSIQDLLVQNRNFLIN